MTGRSEHFGVGSGLTRAMAGELRPRVVQARGSGASRLYFTLSLSLVEFASRCHKDEGVRARNNQCNLQACG